MNKELHTGTNGNGNTNYLAVTVNESGDWKHVETFDTKAEAINWIKWA